MVNAFPCVFQNDAFYLWIGLTFNDAISDFRSGVLQQLKVGDLVEEDTVIKLTGVSLNIPQYLLYKTHFKRI